MNDTHFPGGGRDPFEDSLADTWDRPDADVDRRLRGLIGPVTPLHAPPYGFERVALRARRRRHRTAFIAAAASVAAVAVAAGAVVAGTRLSSHAIETAGCDTLGRAAPAAWSANLGGRADTKARTGTGTEAEARTGIRTAAGAAAPWSGSTGWTTGSSGNDSGREVMNRKYEWAIGGVLTATALSAGIIAGCSSSAGNGPSASATESGGPSASPSQSVGAVTLPSTTPSGTATNSPTAVPRCHTADLSPAVSIVAGSQGTGHELMNIKLTNDSGHTCTVYGFPGFKLEDMNASGQATRVTRDHAVPTKTITLANGGSAATTARIDFDIPAADEPQTGNCEAPSVYLQITPPDETTQLSATISGGPVTVCQHGAIDVLPFVAGTKGANQ
jgi:hypothetical protein